MTNWLRIFALWIVALSGDLSAQTTQTGRTMHIDINGQTLTIELASTQAVQALQALLPLQLKMQDHLRNEKFSSLPHALPRADSLIGNIEKGDVMLWQGDTLMIFYQSFHSGYRYTKIGKIQSPEALDKLLGGSQAVSVQLSE